MATKLPRHGIARVMSKQGICSRAEAERRVREGRVRFRGRTVTDPEHPVSAAEVHLIECDGVAIQAPQRVYLLLNKPRGLVTTANDEKGRMTVYSCLRDSGLPWVAPVGRLDQASEGALLFSNDPEWAAAITQPESHLDKVYHVQIRGVATAESLAAMTQGVSVDGEVWRMKNASVLRAAEKSTWLTVVLDEGKNRQIRRILEAMGHTVLRLVRISIGPVALGELGKGEWRHLTLAEVEALSSPIAKR